MALRTESQNLAAHSVWEFKSFSLVQPDTTGPYLSCIMEIYIPFLQNSKHIYSSLYSACCPSFRHNFLLPFFQFIFTSFFIYLLCDMLGFKHNNLCQKKYLLQLYLYSLHICICFVLLNYGKVIFVTKNTVAANI